MKKFSILIISLFLFLLSACGHEQTDKYTIIKGNDTFVIDILNQTIRNSKLANNLYKLNVPTTVRNWKTLSKLTELAKTMEI